MSSVFARVMGMKLLITIIQILLLAVVFGMLGLALQAKKHHSAFLPPSAELIADELLSSYDTDENGFISTQELLVGLKAIHEKHFNDRPPRPTSNRPDDRGPQKWLNTLSAEFDANEDGQLSKEELIPLLKELREHAPHRHHGFEGQKSESISPY